MNYTTASRHGSLFLPLRSGAKSPPTEGYASSCLPGKRAICAFPVRRPINTAAAAAATTIATNSNPVGPAGRLPSATTSANKWFKEPKIPIRLNSSTLIRMRNKNPSTNEAIRDSRTNNQLAITAASFLKRDRRMSDYEVAKGTSPFGDASFVKNVFLNIVSRSKAMAAVAAASNPSEDCSVPTSAIYHRISAFSLNDRKSGCNLKFVERVSFEGSAAVAAPPASAAPPAPHPPATDTRAQSEGRLVVAGKSGNSSYDVGSSNLMLQQAAKKLQNGGAQTFEEEDDDEGAVEEEGVDSRPRMMMMMKKKKSSRKYKRAVVVTSLKNSGARFVRKTSSRDAGT